MFSVVIPLWNKRATVAATVASVVAQTFPHWELIIVDDGSTDDGANTLCGFDDPRIRMIAQSHKGPGAARNAGLHAAKCDWIAFLDADDLWMPDHLSELDRIRTAYPGAGLIGTAFGMSVRCENYRRWTALSAKIEPVSFLEGVARGNPPFCTSSTAIPRSTYTRLGGFG